MADQVEITTDLGHTPRGERRRAPRASAEDMLAMQLSAFGLHSGWVRQHRFLATRRFRFDFAHPETKLAVEIDGGAWIGGRHTRGTGIEADHEKQNLAVLNGWRVLRFTPARVSDRTAIETIHKAMRNSEHARHD